MEARGAWCPSEDWSARREQWLELDLGATRVVHALRVRGDPQYVRSPSPPPRPRLRLHSSPLLSSPDAFSVLAARRWQISLLITVHSALAAN